MGLDHRDERRRIQRASRIVTEADDAAMVAAFIRTRGITRCPTACAVATQATIGAADRALLRARMAEDDARRVLTLHGRFRRPPAPSEGEGALSPPRPVPAPEIGAKGRAAHKAAADQFALSLLPIIAAIRAGGVDGLTAIAEALNARGIGAPRGGKWRGSAVRRLLDRNSADGSPATPRLPSPQP